MVKVAGRFSGRTRILVARCMLHRLSRAVGSALGIVGAGTAARAESGCVPSPSRNRLLLHPQVSSVTAASVPHSPLELAARGVHHTHFASKLTECQSATTLLCHRPSTVPASASRDQRHRQAGAEKRATRSFRLASGACRISGCQVVPALSAMYARFEAWRMQEIAFVLRKI